MSLNTEYVLVDDEGLRVVYRSLLGRVADGRAYVADKYSSNITSTNGIRLFITTGTAPPRLAFNVEVTANSKVTFHESVAFNTASILTDFNMNRSILPTMEKIPTCSVLFLVFRFDLNFQ